MTAEEQAIENEVEEITALFLSAADGYAAPSVVGACIYTLSHAYSIIEHVDGVRESMIASLQNLIDTFNNTQPTSETLH